MNKYHINPTTGMAGQCKAIHQCRFSASESEHYDSKEEAREAFEKSMIAGTIPESVAKNLSPTEIKDLEAKITKRRKTREDNVRRAETEKEIIAYIRSKEFNKTNTVAQTPESKPEKVWTETMVKNRRIIDSNKALVERNEALLKMAPNNVYTYKRLESALERAEADHKLLVDNMKKVPSVLEETELAVAEVNYYFARVKTANARFHNYLHFEKDKKAKRKKIITEEENKLYLKLERAIFSNKPASMSEEKALELLTDLRKDTLWEA